MDIDKKQDEVVKEQEKKDDQKEVDIESLQHQLEEQTKKAEEYFNRLIRLQADFENYRKRTLKEKEEFLKFANEQLITELLPVMDNFERALLSGHENPNGLLEGVDMIYRQLCDLLKTHGLRPVQSVGEKFDPTRHEAVLQEETNEENDGIILEELRKGYFFKDKVIRPSMVKVARTKKGEQEGDK